jgi:FkbM family methyltransferase
MVRLVNWVLRVAYGNIISSNGCSIDTNSPVVTPWVRSLLFWGFYERAELRFVKKYLPADCDVIELGGSIGVVSSLIARRLEPGRQLISVEANPDSIRLLRENAERNATGSRVSVHNRAIAYGERPLDFVEIAFGESNLAAWVSRQSDSQQRLTRVPATTLAALLSEHGIREYALVSDIEGAEAGLFLLGGQELENCTLIIVELHPTKALGHQYSVPDLVRILTEALGFSLKDQHRDVYVFVRA